MFYDIWSISIILGYFDLISGLFWLVWPTVDLWERADGCQMVNAFNAA